jgi:hypothetical protein
MSLIDLLALISALVNAHYMFFVLPDKNEEIRYWRKRYWGEVLKNAKDREP